MLTRGDYYMHLADLTSYVQAQQRVSELYADPEVWTPKAIINVACSGKFPATALAEWDLDVIASCVAGGKNVQTRPLSSMGRHFRGILRGNRAAYAGARS